MQAKAELLVLIAKTGLTDHKTSLTAQATGDTNSAMKNDVITKAEDQIWRVPIISYLKILVAVQRGIFNVALKYVLIDDELNL